MTWLIALLVCTFLLVTGYTAKYKEIIVELKEEKLEDKQSYETMIWRVKHLRQEDRENFDKEVLQLLTRIHELEEELGNYVRRQ